MAAQNNDGSTKRIGGATGKGFLPGKSGNPGGRSSERDELRRYLVSSYGRESIDGIAKLAREARSEKVKLDARVWLAEQAIGRALVAVGDPDGKPLAAMGLVVLPMEQPE